MNDRETLSRYRMAEAEQTLAGDARKMLASGVSARSVVNRAYYAMFYGVLALLLHEDIEHTTSKHSGIISIFDKTMVHSGGLGRDTRECSTASSTLDTNRTTRSSSSIPSMMPTNVCGWRRSSRQVSGRSLTRASANKNRDPLLPDIAFFLQLDVADSAPVIDERT